MNDQTFNAWNKLKQRIQVRSGAVKLFPRAGEVWFCTIGQNLGFEQNGIGKDFSRPMLVIKKFNNQMFWAAPLSTKQKSFDFYHNFTDHKGEKVSVITAQMRLVSIKRFERFLYLMAQKEFKSIIKELVSFLT